MNRLSILRFIASFVIIAFTANYAKAQSEWENISLAGFSWGTNSQLNISSSTLANLTMYNSHEDSKEDKRHNKWHSQDIVMSINWTESRPWRMSFVIWNSNCLPDQKYKVYDDKGKESWHTGNIYWGYILTVNGSNGEETYTKYYCDRKERNSLYQFTDTYDSDSRRWQPTRDYNKRRVTIEFDGKNTITISSEGKALHTFYATNVSSLRICAGSAAEVHVVNFAVERRTAYGDIIPLVKSGDACIKNQDYWGAIEYYSRAINQGYEAFDIYYKRASAYYAIEFYANAIDDFSSALSYAESADVYLYRGLAKLKRNDFTGIDDLKKGGPRGQALAREFEVDGTNIPGGTIPSSKYKASGTGFFIDTRGYIATNYHVIDGAQGIDVLVTNNGRTTTYSARSVVSDKSNDLAILRIDDTSFSMLSPIPYMISSGTKDVGTNVFAMGYPELSHLGEEIKVTDGIISSKTGYQGDITTYQISAPIQPGNSGGPLFDNNGNVVGITNAGVQSLQNVGYAIKVSYLQNLIEASPEGINLPSNSQISSLSFTEKVKKISPYVVIIKIY